MDTPGMAAEDLTTLAALAAAFNTQPRPAHFTDWQHCCECAEHQATLQAHTPDSIGMAELGNAGRDPICFTTDEGYRYWLPALARLALRPGDYYVDQFLFHLENRPDVFDNGERETVRAFVDHLLVRRWDEISGTVFDLHTIGRILAALAPA